MTDTPVASSNPIPQTPAATSAPSTISATVPVSVVSTIEQVASKVEADAAQAVVEVSFLKANWGKVSIAVIALAVIVFLFARCV